MIQKVRFEIECDHCDQLLELEHVAESGSFVDYDETEVGGPMWAFLRQAADAAGWGCEQAVGTFACKGCIAKSEELD